MTPLFYAQYTYTNLSQTNIAELLIQRGAKVDILDNKGQSLFFHAYTVEMIKLLINNGLDITAKDYENNTLFHRFSNNPAILTFLYENGLNEASSKNINGETPLHSRVTTETIDLLISWGGNIDALDNINSTPIHRNLSDYNIVKHLIEKGANLNIKSDMDLSPLDFALHRKSLNERDREWYKPIIKLLSDNGANSFTNDSIFAAVQVGDIFPVLNLINSGTNIDARNKLGYSALHLAVKSDKKQILEILIENGANVDIEDDFGITTLHYSVLHNKHELMETLLRAGANPDIKNKEGMAPLHSLVAEVSDSTREQRQISINMLLNYGANINLESDSQEWPNMMPLQIALNVNNEKTTNKDWTLINDLKDFVTLKHNLTYTTENKLEMKLTVNAAITNGEKKWKLEHSYNLESWEYNSGPFNRPMKANDTRVVEISKTTNDKSLFFRLVE